MCCIIGLTTGNKMGHVRKLINHNWNRVMSTSYHIETEYKVYTNVSPWGMKDR